MNAIATGTRVAAFVIVICLAVAAGVLVGNAIQNRQGADGAGLGGFVPENRGGTIVETQEYLDFGLRHPAPEQEYLDYGLRHAADDAANGAPATVNAPTPR